MKTWFSSNSPQQQMFNNADKFKHQFYVARQIRYPSSPSPVYNYTSFKCIDNFLSYQKKWEGKLTFNELIRENQPCREYYDFDGLWSDGWNNVLDYVLEFLRLRADFAKDKSNNINNLPVSYKDLIITEACNAKKLSLHIIVDQPCYFKNTGDQMVWANAFSNWIKTKHPMSKIKLDTSVYNKNSVFRCLVNSKVDDLHRKFRPYGLAKYIRDRRMLYVTYIEKYFGLVGEVSYMYLPINLPVVKEVKKKVKKIRKLSTYEEEKACSDMVRSLKKERAENYVDWCAIGHALYDTLNGSEKGLSIFLEFSARCKDKYDEKICTNYWNNIKEPAYTKGTIIHYFKEDNPPIIFAKFF